MTEPHRTWIETETLRTPLGPFIFLGCAFLSLAVVVLVALL